jgi:hypothetical protein
MSLHRAGLPIRVDGESPTAEKQAGTISQRRNNQQLKIAESMPSEQMC